MSADAVDVDEVPQRISVSVRGRENVATVLSALHAVADEMDLDLDRTPSHTRPGAINTGDALVEISRAYTGWTPGEDPDP